MTEKTTTYGVQIDHVNRSGSHYVVCRVMRRDGDDHHPLNCTNYWADQPYLEGLCLEGYVSDTDGSFVGLGVMFRDVYSVTARKAKAMAKMLDKCERQINRDAAREHGDILVSFCKAVGAKWCVQEMVHRGSTLRDSEWQFMSVAEGRNHYRHVISEARKAAGGGSSEAAA